MINPFITKIAQYLLLAIVLIASLYLATGTWFVIKNRGFDRYINGSYCTQPLGHCVDIDYATVPRYTFAGWWSQKVGSNQYVPVDLGAAVGIIVISSGIIFAKRRRSR